MQDRLSDYETQINTLKASADDSETLKNKISELEKAIADRKAADDAARDAAVLNERFDKVSADKKFLNDYTRNGVIAEFKNALLLEENKGKGDAEVFAALIKDRDGIFASDNPPATIPGTDPIGADTLDDAHVRAVMGLPAKN